MMLERFLPFISLFSLGDDDAQVSLAAMMSRLKLASDLMCWTKFKGFQRPVYAYLNRKLQPVLCKNRSLLNAPRLMSREIILVAGDLYYLCLGEQTESGDAIYLPVRLLQFKIFPTKVFMLLEFLDASGYKCDEKAFYFSKSIALATAFVPKVEFEAQPIGAVFYSTPALSLAAPVDWSSYGSDMNLILSHIASRCMHFKLSASMLPRSVAESQFVVQRGSSQLRFTQIDHGMSFKPFFSETMSSCDEELRRELLGKPALCETNRCFFIHLGVALGLHPVAIQAIFRAHSQVLLHRIRKALSQKTHEDDQRFDVVNMFEASLQSVLNHNDMIEASILGILWPQEFQVAQLIQARRYCMKRAVIA
jgi:hypothetical protein